MLICYQEIVDLRGKCPKLFNFDWMNIPLAYTQVRVTIRYPLDKPWFIRVCMHGIYELVCLVALGINELEATWHVTWYPWSMFSLVRLWLLRILYGRSQASYHPSKSFHSSTLKSFLLLLGQFIVIRLSITFCLLLSCFKYSLFVATEQLAS